jgi:tetratricopeptide (TPR) repeat protein
MTRPAFLSSASIAAVLLACSVMSLPAAAGTDEDAKKHFDAGESYFRTSDYEGALREFETAFKLSKRPLILLNIVNVYERMGKWPAAIEAIEQYLAADPGSRQRATLELRIQNLRKRVEAMAAEAPDPEPPAPVPSASAPAVSAQPAAPASVPTPAPSAGPPDRTMAYVGWGIGGAAAVGALVTGLMANSKYADAESGCAKTAQGCADAEVDPIKNLALVSTVLTGVAVIGAGVGTWLYLSARPQPAEPTGLTPRVGGGFARSGAAVSAIWTF